MSDGQAELRQLIVNLEHVAEAAFDEVDAVIKKGALNIKNEMIADVKKSHHFVGKKGPGLESSITFEHENSRGSARRVIGPDKDRPGGALGNIYYFGTSRGGGSGDIDKPLRNEEPRTRAALEALATRWAEQI